MALAAVFDFLAAHLWLTAALIILITFYAFKRATCGPGNLPPGPLGLPVLGYLPFLTENQHLDFLELEKKYGRIFSLKIGVRLAVVVSDFAAIKEAFNREEISDKPPDMFKISEHVRHLGDQIDWKDWRRFTLSTLRTLGMGKNKLEAAIEEQVERVLRQLHRSSGDVNLHEVIAPAVNSIIISLICGKKLKEDSAFSKVVDAYSNCVLEYWKVTGLKIFLPFLKPIIPYFSSIRQSKKVMDLLEGNLWEEIASHEEELGDSPPENFIDFFLKECEKNPGRKDLSKDKLNGNSQLLLLAGNDTLISTIEWVLLRLVQHPDVQEKAYKEIIQAFGKERIPTFHERTSLPYLDAVLAESSRFSTIVPLAVPHWTSRDTKICGYDIPEHTMVYDNIYSVHMDPELWNEPERFNPDRFLTSDGKRTKDPDYLTPFGTGKRSCPGEKLAREEVFVFVAAILQHFQILPPSSGLNMDVVTTIVLHPKSPLVRIKPRE